MCTRRMHSVRTHPHTRMQLVTCAPPSAHTVQTHHAQNDDARSVCLASTPCTDLNHWRSTSTSDTSAMGTWGSDAMRGARARRMRGGACWVRGVACRQPPHGLALCLWPHVHVFRNRPQLCRIARLASQARAPAHTLKIMQQSFVKLSKRGSGSCVRWHGVRAQVAWCVGACQARGRRVRWRLCRSLQSHAAGAVCRCPLPACHSPCPGFPSLANA